MTAWREVATDVRRTLIASGCAASLVGSVLIDLEPAWAALGSCLDAGLALALVAMAADAHRRAGCR